MGLVNDASREETLKGESLFDCVVQEYNHNGQLLYCFRGTVEDVSRCFFELDSELLQMGCSEGIAYEDRHEDLLNEALEALKSNPEAFFKEYCRIVRPEDAVRRWANAAHTDSNPFSEDFCGNQSFVGRVCRSSRTVRNAIVWNGQFVANGTP
jgi:hypothetical protein